MKIIFRAAAAAMIGLASINAAAASNQNDAEAEKTVLTPFEQARGALLEFEHSMDGKKKTPDQARELVRKTLDVLEAADDATLDFGHATPEELLGYIASAKAELTLAPDADLSTRALTAFDKAHLVNANYSSRSLAHYQVMDPSAEDVKRIRKKAEFAVSEMGAVTIGTLDPATREQFDILAGQRLRVAALRVAKSAFDLIRAMPDTCTPAESRRLAAKFKTLEGVISAGLQAAQATPGNLFPDQQIDDGNALYQTITGNARMRIASCASRR